MQNLIKTSSTHLEEVKQDDLLYKAFRGSAMFRFFRKREMPSMLPEMDITERDVLRRMFRHYRELDKIGVDKCGGFVIDFSQFFDLLIIFLYTRDYYPYNTLWDFTDTIKDPTGQDFLEYMGDLHKKLFDTKCVLKNEMFFLEMDGPIRIIREEGGIGYWFEDEDFGT